MPRIDSLEDLEKYAAEVSQKIEFGEPVQQLEDGSVVIGTWEPRRRGRPFRLVEPDHIHLRLEARAKSRLSMRAKEKGMNVSDYLRDLIDQHLDGAG